jgi:hypothetical protein
MSDGRPLFDGTPTQSEMPGQDSGAPGSATWADWKIDPGHTGTSQGVPEGWNRPAGPGDSGAEGYSVGNHPNMEHNSADVGYVGSQAGTDDHNSSSVSFVSGDADGHGASSAPDADAPDS